MKQQTNQPTKQYALKFSRNGAPYLFVYESNELKQAQRKLHLLKLFGHKEAVLTNYHKR